MLISFLIQDGNIGELIKESLKLIDRPRYLREIPLGMIVIWLLRVHFGTVILND